MANTPDLQPPDLDHIRDALVNAPDYLGWEHITALVAEVDRLRAEVDGFEAERDALREEVDDLQNRIYDAPRHP